MKPELKKQWVEALRSGKYEQGEKTLKTPDDKFCCLGVLCDISGLGKWVAVDGVLTYVSGRAKAAGYLGTRFAEIFGLPTTTGFYPRLPDGFREKHRLESFDYNLAGLNDAGVPFNVIADLIEKEQL